MQINGKYKTGFVTDESHVSFVQFRAIFSDSPITAYRQKQQSKMNCPTYFQAKHRSESTLEKSIFERKMGKNYYNNSADNN